MTQSTEPDILQGPCLIAVKALLVVRVDGEAGLQDAVSLLQLLLLHLQLRYLAHDTLAAFSTAWT